MRRKSCFGLLLVCSIIVGSLLSGCLDVNAASSSWYSTWSIYDTGSGTWASANVGSFVALSSNFYTNLIRYSNQNLQKFSANDLVSFSGTFITLMDYYDGSLNSPPIVECPQPIMSITTLDCDISSSHDVSGSQHFSVFSWTYTGTMSQDWDLTALQFRTYIKNNANSSIRFYSGSLVYNIGEDNVVTNTQAIRSFNNDVSSYIGSVVSANNANASTINSTIQSFNSDFNNYRINTYNQLNSIDSNVSDIWDYLQDKQDQEEEDRDNIEEQSSDIDSDASDSSSDAQQQGTTLLGAFSAFVTALTSANPSNCVLDMDLGNLDLGNVDFCTLSPPQPIPTIASIFLILFCVPLSIATAKKVINLFRSFQ